MIFSSRWLETERKQLREEAGIKRDAMRLPIAQTVVYTKRTFPTAPPADKHQRKVRSVSVRIHRSEYYLVLSWNSPSCLEATEVWDFPSLPTPQPTPMSGKSLYVYVCVCYHTNAKNITPRSNNPLPFQQHLRYTRYAVESKKLHNPGKPEMQKLASPNSGLGELP